VDTNEGSKFQGFIQSQKSGALGSSQSQTSFYSSDTYSTDIESEQEDLDR